MIFVSHANPEDNEFARWLSLQLAKGGFRVWSDVTKLIGGEKFWTDIEQAITKETIKFLFCVSKDVNKPGVLRELDLALETEKRLSRPIIVPLKIDGTSFSAIPRDLGASVNAIRFDDGGAQGLLRLFDMLKRDEILPENSDGFAIVNEWWRKAFPVTGGILEGEEVCVSNLFPTSKPAERIWYHPAARRVPRGFKGEGLKVIAEPFGNGFVSFCEPREMAAAGRRFAIQTKKSDYIGWEEFITNGIKDLKLEQKDANRLAYALLRRGFERHASSRGCRRYALSNDRLCHWLEKDFLPDDEASFVANGKRHSRSLVGFKSMTANKDGVKPKRWWHFAVQGVPTFDLSPGIILKTHVVFTSDGKKLFDSASYQHSARRNQGKSWWNDVWRDRLLAMMSFLASGGDEFRVQMAKDAYFSFSTQPVQFVAPVKYLVIDKESRDDLPDDDEDGNELPTDAENE